MVAKSLILLSVFTIFFSEFSFAQKDTFNNRNVGGYKDNIGLWQKKKIDSTIFLAQEYLEDTAINKTPKKFIALSKILANLYHIQSQYYKETKVLLNALPYVNDSTNILTKANLLYRLGEASRGARKFKAGIEYLNEAQKIYQTKNKELELAKTYNRKAAIFYKLEFTDFSNTFKNLDKSMKLAKKLNDIELIANNLEIKAAIYEYEKDYKRALIYYHQVIQIFKKNNKTPFPNIYISLCIAYYHTRKYSKSVKYGKKALEIIGEKGSKPQLETITDFLSYSYFALGNYKNAYNYIRKSAHYHNIQFDEKKDAKLTELEKRYQLLKKENEIKRQKKINKYNKSQIGKKQDQIIFLTLSLLLGILLLFIFYLQKRNSTKYNSQLKIKNNEIARKNQELIEVNHFKNLMTSTLVHDLKNPINIIMGLCQTTKTNNEITRIYNSALLMHSHILNLLDVNKYENTKIKLNLKKIKISEVIYNAYNQTKELFNAKGINFIHQQSSDYILEVDESLIERVFVNLFINSIKFTPQNGNIRISITPTNSKFIHISISDTGIGIPDDEHSMVFEKYYQKNNKYETNSTGLGLTFCKIAIENHGGTIELVRNKEIGTEVIINLPYTNTKEIKVLLNQKLINQEFKEELSIKNKKILIPYVEKLKELDVGCISDIKEVLTEFKKLNIDNLYKFTEKISLSLEKYNQKMYEIIVKKMEL